MFTSLLRYSVITLIAVLSVMGSPLSSTDASERSAPNFEIVYADLNTIPEVSMENKITDWIQTLSKQSGWENWKNAKWTVSPLGPGTHGWIVELTEGTQAIGYMIVLATETGDYVLSEYGKGESPLFSKETLSSALQWQGIVNEDAATAQAETSNEIKAQRFYYDALQAFWMIETKDQTVYLDAITGEELPFDKLPNLQLQSVTQVHHKLIGTPDTLLRSTFDPYDDITWVTAEPLFIKQLSDLQKAMETNSQLTYVGNLYENTHQVPAAVLGYSHWQGNEEPYLIIDQNVERYIPLSTAILLGYFYS
jgi:hypothetical protein